jgi:hypothetical protein
LGSKLLRARAKMKKLGNENEEMTGERIHSLLSGNRFTRNLFLGVFSADTLPRVVLSRPSFLIVNSDASFRSGTHWLAIFLPRLASCWYFDSYGQPPSHPSIITFLKRNSSRSYDYNRKRLQRDDTATCGSFVVAASYLFARGGSIEEINSLFKSFHQRDNEARVKEIVRCV